MNLKKNDKIILVVGVVILIVAGAGIALYTAPGSDNDDVGEASQQSDYMSSWIKKTGEVSLDDILEASKSEPFTKTVSINPSSQCVLTNVEFDLDWMDDRTFGLFKNKGLDTLTFEVSRNGNTKTESSTGEGNHTFSFNINSKPMEETIEAESESDAEDWFLSQIAGKNSETFDVTVTVDIGEPRFRLIKYFRDKGNDFDLSVEYTYYTLEIGMDDGDDDTKPSGGNDDDVITNNHYVGEFYINLGFGRSMI